MVLRLSKYFHVINIGFQNTLVYRWNFLIRVLFSFIPLMGTFHLWKAITEGGDGGKIAGYTFAQMISYFLALILLDSLASPTEDDFQIADEIREGTINQFLLKPIDYLWYRFTLFWSYRLIYTATTIIPVLILLFFMREYLTFSANWNTWVLSLFALVLSATLQFFMAYCAAMMAFWLLEVSAPIFMIYSIEYLAGGHVFPLDLLDKSGVIYQAIMLTPFPYEYWFPVAVFSERITNAKELIHGFQMQLLWCAIFYLLARWTWRQGIRKYTAVGG